MSYNTRITPTSCTLLDLFVTTRRDLISESGVYPLEISHHNLVYVTMKLKNKRPPLKCIRMRDYKRLDQDKFQSDIESAPFHMDQSLTMQTPGFEYGRNYTSTYAMSMLLGNRS